MSFGWALLARVVGIETWMHLVLLSAAAHPVAALLVVTVGTAMALVLIRAAVRVIRVMSSIALASWVAVPTASKSQPELWRRRTSVMLASGHGARAPGQSVRRPAVRIS